MAIQSLGNNGGTICTGQGVNVFRLISLKGMLRMEKVGMKTRGGSIRPRIAAEFGLKPRAPYDDYIAAVDAKLKEMEPVIAAENAALAN